MELSDAWIPEVTYEEVKADGTLLDDKYDPMPDSDAKNKRICSLYYLKSKNLFVTYTNGFVDTMYTNPLHVITSETVIGSLRHKYFKEEPKKSVDDAFMEHDDSDFTMFQSEVDLSSSDAVKKNGTLLETDKWGNQTYYVKSVDRFVCLQSSEAHYTFDSLDTRKKYNIPYQDERFN